MTGVVVSCRRQQHGFLVCGDLLRYLSSCPTALPGQSWWIGTSSPALSPPAVFAVLLPSPLPLMSPLSEGPACLLQLSWIRQLSLAPGPHPLAASRDEAGSHFPSVGCVGWTQLVLGYRGGVSDGEN